MIKILKKQATSPNQFEALAICGQSVYYLNVIINPEFWVIRRVFLLEEIPSSIELRQRLQHYITAEGYYALSSAEINTYIKQLAFFLSLFLTDFDLAQLSLFPDIYTQDGYHADLVGLYRCLGGQLDSNFIKNPDGFYVKKTHTVKSKKIRVRPKLNK